MLQSRIQSMEILELLKKPEGKTLEFKQDLSSLNPIVRSVVAFANTAGGVLLIGIEDKTHYILGINEPLLAEERIANIISDNISPQIIPEIDIIPWRDTYVIAAHIYPSSNRPHFIKSMGARDGVYIRVGSTNRKADTAIIRELERITHHQSYDESPLPHLSSEDIDFRAASELFAPMKALDTVNDLESLGLITKYQNHLVPTVAGIVLFGKNREKIFPDAWIQVGRFQGIDKTTIIDSLAIHQYPVLAVQKALEFVEKHSMRAIEIKKIKHQIRWSVPIIALREAVINAVVHADYSQQGAPIRIAIFDNRIEIENPGLLRFGLTTDDIMAGISKLRNRTIGKIFNKLGLIEQWGSGIKRMCNSCKDAGFPLPVFEEIATHFRVTLFNEQERKPKVDQKDQAIISALKESESLSTQEIAKRIILSARATRTRLIRLIELGYIVEIASNEQDPNRQYLLSEKIDFLLNN
jgi:ATP-dependent DNA helicase RecG